MKAMKIKRTKILAAIAAVVFVFAFWLSALPARTAYASTAAPTAISVTYYNGVYTRGWNWRTESAVTDGVVQLVEKTGSVSKFNVKFDSPDITVTATSSSNLPGGATGDTSANKIWKANHDFTAAADGKTYLYRVGSPSSDSWSATGEQTIDGGGNGVYLLHTTDPQGSNATDFGFWKQTLDKAYATHPATQTVITTGDYVNSGSNISEWNWMLNLPQTVLMDTVMTPVAGNHELGTSWFNAHFNVVLAGNSYYSYDIGNVHVTVLYTVPGDYSPFTIATAQANWLKQDLQDANNNPNTEWKIVAMHVPVVSTGNHGVLSYLEAWRNQLFPIMAQYQVDLVLQGHDHVYARSNPLLWSNAAGNIAASSYATQPDNFFGENRTYMTEPDGTSYVIINTAANKEYAANTGSALPAFMRPGTNVLAANVQPGASMFGAVSIRESVLLYESYTVNRSTGATALYDHFGVIRNTENLPAKMPAITTQPQGSTEGDTGYLSVVASSPDGGTLSYQWYGSVTNTNKGGAAITGATSAAYSFNVTASPYPHYYVVVTNTTNGKTASRSSAVASFLNRIAPPSFGVTVPEEGQTPNTQITVTEGEGFAAALAWIGMSAQITLTAENGYTFAGYGDLAAISEFKVNGRAPTHFFYVTPDGKTLRFLVNFAEDGEEENNEEEQETTTDGGCGGNTQAFWAVFVLAAAVLFKKRV
ncbi:MAG: metallophosphoesterase [Firmicutes bacterium]|nr:metallophosphoesterase [Bacillota bacterium]